MPNESLTYKMFTMLYDLNVALQEAGGIGITNEMLQGKLETFLDTLVRNNIEINATAWRTP